MTREELNYIKDAFSQIIDDIAGNPDWHEAARAVASDLGTLERELEKKVTSLPTNLDEAAEEYGRKEYSHAIHFWDEGLSKNKPEVMKEDFVDSFKAGAEWMAGQGWSLDGEVKDLPTGGDDFEIYLDYDGDKMDDILDEICDYVNANYPDDDNRYKVVVQIRKK